MLPKATNRNALGDSSASPNYSENLLASVRAEKEGMVKEWFPSVSSTIGDWYPERNIFHTFIALTAPPRLFLLGVWYYACTSTKFTQGKTKYATWLFIVGFLRTLTCAGWMFVTSSDDHDVHDISMILYIVLTIPYMIMTVSSGSRLTQFSRSNPELSKKVSFYRKFTGISFFVILVPMIYFFLQHKISKVAGAYTIYAFHEWSLIFLDIFFDSYSYFEFEYVELAVLSNQAKQAE
ncbi:Protein CWH43 [Smittium culicis]|uniref:Protein CWH43 n=1 Tax=Smittium culicis TaxID=133412 RepID=A0A1R1XU58_9FUNG|nr:Protein CWH43 [Smittium culicis]